MSTTTRKICVLGLAAIAGLGAGGCSTSRVGGRGAVGGEGSNEPAVAAAATPAWDSVMPGEFLAADADAELARRDESLNIHRPEPLLASNQWPNAPRPLFERPWRVQLPRQPESVLQFLPPAAGSRYYHRDSNSTYWRP